MTTKTESQSDQNVTRRIGRNLRDIRRNGGYTQQQIAQLLGTSFQQVQKYENGKNRLPIDKLLRLKHFYGIRFSAFFSGVSARGDLYESCDFDALLARVSAVRDGQKRYRLYRAMADLADLAQI
ncbi:MAG: helix-turn-helix domain-containing protein [Bdellovibrionales bacterium]